MIKQSVSLFNEYHGVNAQVHTIDQHHYTLLVGDTMRGFTSKSELINFLMCGTSHLPFVGQDGAKYYTAYNLAMMYLNRRCGGIGHLVYSVADNGKATLWGRDGAGWFKVGEYSCLTSLYRAILEDGASIIRLKVRAHSTFLARLKRLLF